MRAEIATGVLIAALLSAGCGEGFSTAVLVTLSGATGSAGGGYQIELRQADGSLQPGTEAAFVDFQPGDQEVGLALADDALFDGVESVLARVYVEVWAGADGPASALGSALVTLERGQTAELDLELHEDPRPWDGEATARYFTSDALPGIRVEASAGDELGGYTLHVWSERDGALTWLGASAELSGSLEAPLAGGDGIVERDGESYHLTLEPGDDTDQLAASNGWSVASGELAEAVRTELEPALGVAMPGLLALAGHAEQHAGFAASSADVGMARDHAEHVFNIVSGAAGESDFGAGGVDYAGVADTTGIDSYREQAVAAAAVAAEAVVDGVQRATILAEAQACSLELAVAVSEVRAAASDFILVDASPAQLELMIAATERLRGDPFAADASGDDLARQTGACLNDRIEALTTFGLDSVAVTNP